MIKPALSWTLPSTWKVGVLAQQVFNKTDMVVNRVRGKDKKIQQGKSSKGPVLGVLGSDPTLSFIKTHMCRVQWCFKNLAFRPINR